MNFLPYEATELPKEEEEQILAAIGESEIVRKACLETLKGMLQGTVGMLKVKLKPCLDDDFLLPYLRRCNFNCDKAAHAILIANEIIMNNPEYFETSVLGALSKSSMNAIQISPLRLKDHSLLVVHQYFKMDTSELPLNEKTYLDTISQYYLLKNKINQICGITFIIDVVDLSIPKIPQYTDYKWITLIVNMIQHAPFRMKKIHIINVSEAAKHAYYNIMLPFLPQSVVDLIHFHSDNTGFKDLQEFIPPEVLPEKYGGLLKEYDFINCSESILKKEDYFRKHFPLVKRK